MLHAYMHTCEGLYPCRLKWRPEVDIGMLSSTALPPCFFHQFLSLNLERSCLCFPVLGLQTHAYYPAFYVASEGSELRSSYLCG